MADRQEGHAGADWDPVSAMEGTMSESMQGSAARYEVRFASLFNPGRALSFPCDAQGRVDVEALPAPARDNYRVACAKIGREYSLPQVAPAEPSRH